MRILGLDLLRILAVLLVIGRHLHLPTDANVGLHLWQRGGWVGVDLFFVLSGFLVSTLLFREQILHGKINVSRFLIRRGFKIYPAFWVFLAVTIGIRYLVGTFPSQRQLLGELFFLQNYVGAVWNHTWSLAVEEHFYLAIAVLFGVLVTAKPRDPFSALPVIFVLVGIACLAMRVSNMILHPVYSHDTYLFPTHIRVDSLLFGVLLAYLYNFHELNEKLAWIPSWVLLGIGGLLLAPAFVFSLEDHKWVSVVGLVLFYLGSGACLIGAIRLKSSDNLPLQVLGALGAASYSIYLWHMPVGTWGYIVVSRLSGIDNLYLYLFTSVVLSCLFGWFLSVLIEDPALRARDWLFPSRSGRAVPVEKS